MTIYHNDNPIKSKYIANMRYDQVGYVRNPKNFIWEIPNTENKNVTTPLPTPGIVVEFPWSDQLSESEISSYNKYQKNNMQNGFGSITKDGPDMFPSSKEYMVYKMFCELMGSTNRILITNENKSTLFFEQNDSLDETRIANVLNKLNKFADMVEYGFAWLTAFIEKQYVDKEYREELKRLKTSLENFYNDEILPYATYKFTFYEWNIIDFILPKEPIGTWIPDDNDNIEKLKESREKVFGDFSRNTILKKVYFDLYELCMDEIVDYQWRMSGVGKGWKCLIQKAFEKFRWREKQSFFWWRRISAAQIKEKWGQFRCYFDFPSDWYFENVIDGGDEEDSLNKAVEDYIFELECESGEICEGCGKTHDEDPTVETKANFGHGWVQTLCNTCREEKLKEVENAKRQFEEKVKKTKNI